MGQGPSITGASSSKSVNSPAALCSGSITLAVAQIGLLANELNQHNTLAVDNIKNCLQYTSALSKLTFSSLKDNPTGKKNLLINLRYAEILLKKLAITKDLNRDKPLLLEAALRLAAALNLFSAICEEKNDTKVGLVQDQYKTLVPYIKRIESKLIPNSDIVDATILSYMQKPSFFAQFALDKNIHLDIQKVLKNQKRIKAAKQPKPAAPLIVPIESSVRKSTRKSTHVQPEQRGLLDEDDNNNDEEQSPIISNTTTSTTTSPNPTIPIIQLDNQSDEEIFQQMLNEDEQKHPKQDQEPPAVETFEELQNQVNGAPSTPTNTAFDHLGRGTNLDDDDALNDLNKLIEEIDEETQEEDVSDLLNRTSLRQSIQQPQRESVPPPPPQESPQDRITQILIEKFKNRDAIDDQTLRDSIRAIGGNDPNFCFYRDVLRIAYEYIRLTHQDPTIEIADIIATGNNGDALKQTLESHFDNMHRGGAWATKNIKIFPLLLGNLTSPTQVGHFVVLIAEKIGGTNPTFQITYLDPLGGNIPPYLNTMFQQNAQAWGGNYAVTNNNIVYQNNGDVTSCGPISAFVANHWVNNNRQAPQQAQCTPQGSRDFWKAIILPVLQGIQQWRVHNPQRQAPTPPRNTTTQPQPRTMVPPPTNTPKPRNRAVSNADYNQGQGGVLPNNNNNDYFGHAHTPVATTARPQTPFIPHLDLTQVNAELQKLTLKLNKLLQDFPNPIDIDETNYDKASAIKEGLEKLLPSAQGGQSHTINGLLTLVNPYIAAHDFKLLIASPLQVFFGLKGDDYPQLRDDLQKLLPLADDSLKRKITLFIQAAEACIQSPKLKTDFHSGHGLYSWGGALFKLEVSLADFENDKDPKNDANFKNQIDLQLQKLNANLLKFKSNAVTIPDQNLSKEQYIQAVKDLKLKNNLKKIFKKSERKAFYAASLQLLQEFITAITPLLEGLKKLNKTDPLLRFIPSLFLDPIINAIETADEIVAVVNQLKPSRSAQLVAQRDQLKIIYTDLSRALMGHCETKYSASDLSHFAGNFKRWEHTEKSRPSPPHKAIEYLDWAKNQLHRFAPPLGSPKEKFTWTRKHLDMRAAYEDQLLLGQRAYAQINANPIPIDPETQERPTDRNLQKFIADQIELEIQDKPVEQHAHISSTTEANIYYCLSAFLFFKAEEELKELYIKKEAVEKAKFIQDVETFVHDEGTELADISAELNDEFDNYSNVVAGSLPPLRAVLTKDNIIRLAGTIIPATQLSLAKIERVASLLERYQHFKDDLHDSDFTVDANTFLQQLTEDTKTDNNVTLGTITPILQRRNIILYKKIILERMEILLQQPEKSIPYAQALQEFNEKEFALDKETPEAYCGFIFALNNLLAASGKELTSATPAIAPNLTSADFAELYPEENAEKASVLQHFQNLSNGPEPRALHIQRYYLTCYQQIALRKLVAFIKKDLNIKEDLNIKKDLKQPQSKPEAAPEKSREQIRLQNLWQNITNLMNTTLQEAGSISPAMHPGSLLEKIVGLEKFQDILNSNDYKEDRNKLPPEDRIIVRGHQRVLKENLKVYKQRLYQVMVAPAIARVKGGANNPLYNPNNPGHFDFEVDKELLQKFLDDKESLVSPRDEFAALLAKKQEVQDLLNPPEQEGLPANLNRTPQPSRVVKTPRTTQEPKPISVSSSDLTPPLSRVVSTPKQRLRARTEDQKTPDNSAPASQNTSRNPSLRIRSQTAPVGFKPDNNILNSPALNSPVPSLSQSTFREDEEELTQSTSMPSLLASTLQNTQSLPNGSIASSAPRNNLPPVHPHATAARFWLMEQKNEVTILNTKLQEQRLQNASSSSIKRKAAAISLWATSVPAALLAGWSSSLVITPVGGFFVMLATGGGMITTGVLLWKSGTRLQEGAKTNLEIDYNSLLDALIKLLTPQIDSANPVNNLYIDDTYLASGVAVRGEPKRFELAIHILNTLQNLDTESVPANPALFMQCFIKLWAMKEDLNGKQWVREIPQGEADPKFNVILTTAKMLILKTLSNVNLSASGINLDGPLTQQVIKKLAENLDTLVRDKTLPIEKKREIFNLWIDTITESQPSLLCRIIGEMEASDLISDDLLMGLTDPNLATEIQNYGNRAIDLLLRLSPPSATHLERNKLENDRAQKAGELAGFYGADNPRQLAQRLKYFAAKIPKANKAQRDAILHALIPILNSDEIDLAATLSYLSAAAASQLLNLLFNYPDKFSTIDAAIFAGLFKKLKNDSPALLKTALINFKLACSSNNRYFINGIKEWLLNQNIRLTDADDQNALQANLENLIKLILKEFVKGTGDETEKATARLILAARTEFYRASGLNPPALNFLTSDFTGKNPADQAQAANRQLFQWSQQNAYSILWQANRTPKDTQQAIKDLFSAQDIEELLEARIQLVAAKQATQAAQKIVEQCNDDPLNAPVYLAEAQQELGRAQYIEQQAQGKYDAKTNNLAVCFNCLFADHTQKEAIFARLNNNQANDRFSLLFRQQLIAYYVETFLDNSSSLNDVVNFLADLEKNKNFSNKDSAHLIAEIFSKIRGKQNNSHTGLLLKLTDTRLISAAAAGKILFLLLSANIYEHSNELCFTLGVDYPAANDDYKLLRINMLLAYAEKATLDELKDHFIPIVKGVADTGGIDAGTTKDATTMWATDILSSNASDKIKEKVLLALFKALPETHNEDTSTAEDQGNLYTAIKTKITTDAATKVANLTLLNRVYAQLDLVKSIKLTAAKINENIELLTPMRPTMFFMRTSDEDTLKKLVKGPHAAQSNRTLIKIANDLLTMFNADNDQKASFDTAIAHLLKESFTSPKRKDFTVKLCMLALVKRYDTRPASDLQPADVARNQQLFEIAATVFAAAGFDKQSQIIAFGSSAPGGFRNAINPFPDTNLSQGTYNQKVNDFFNNVWDTNPMDTNAPKFTTVKARVDGNLNANLEAERDRVDQIINSI